MTSGRTERQVQEDAWGRCWGGTSRREKTHPPWKNILERLVEVIVRKIQKVLSPEGRQHVPCGMKYQFQREEAGDKRK